MVVVVVVVVVVIDRRVLLFSHSGGGAAVRRTLVYRAPVHEILHLMAPRSMAPRTMAPLPVALLVPMPLPLYRDDTETIYRLFHSAKCHICFFIFLYVVRTISYNLFFPMNRFFLKNGLDDKKQM